MRLKCPVHECFICVFAEHILKALNSLETPEEKLAALCKKYADLHEEHRGMKLKFKQSQHKLTGVSFITALLL